MNKIAKSLTALVALLHLYIAWFEIFAWTTKGPKIFSTFPKALFGPTVSMAANQGLYNAFLAFGLIWSLIIKDKVWSKNIALFFLICVAVAGIFGALTVSQHILFVQTVPAVIAIVFVWLARSRAG